MPEKFDIYSKIFYMDVEKFVRHMCRLVLRHQMPVWNYFVNSFYSVCVRVNNDQRIIITSVLLFTVPNLSHLIPPPEPIGTNIFRTKLEYFQSTTPPCGYLSRLLVKLVVSATYPGDFEL
jgi:hypothetical protein